MDRTVNAGRRVGAAPPARSGAAALGIALLFALAACQPGPESPARGAATATRQRATETTADGANAPAVATPARRPGPPTAQPPVESRPEAATPAAATSAQAAATVVETYFAWLQAGRITDADTLWGDATQAAAFRARFEALARPRVEVDAPGDLGGAAGSSYVTVPLRFTPPGTSANPRARMGEVTLRRVNDVPGSTAAQRHWHIERIDVAMTPK